MDWGDLISGGLGLLDTWNASKTRDEYNDLLRQQEEDKYNRELANYNAYNDYLAKFYSGGGGGGSGAGKKQAALGGALRQYKKGLKGLKPYEKAGAAVAPIHASLYSQGADTMSLLNAYLQRPEMMSKLTEPTDIMAVGNPIAAQLPEWMRRGE